MLVLNKRKKEIAHVNEVGTSERQTHKERLFQKGMREREKCLMRQKGREQAQEINPGVDVRTAHKAVVKIWVEQGILALWKR